jgi:hypothetical protein
MAELHTATTHHLAPTQQQQQQRTPTQQHSTAPHTSTARARPAHRTSWHSVAGAGAAALVGMSMIWRNSCPGAGLPSARKRVAGAPDSCGKSAAYLVLSQKCAESIIPLRQTAQSHSHPLSGCVCRRESACILKDRRAVAAIGSREREWTYRQWWCDANQKRGAAASSSRCSGGAPNCPASMSALQMHLISAERQKRRASSE